jgi:hypothetical protein
MVARSITIIPDQDITTPFTTQAGGVTIPVMMYSYRNRRV